ncbi:porin family protein [uncultured Imperialibacter sp.]|uniref:porin family protein n=1 Tax=uncultured Imperialibacter sp. TaxID=1672639 RepID=UPI0030D95C23|tara:strand:+ start:24824 stop:25918 length:1095 start_codon:yes stop_codon:yes gene_type:complete
MKSYQHKLLSIAIIFSVFNSLKAQDFNSQNGYLITLDGDTIHGQVKMKQDLYGSVSFKSKNSVQYDNYSPSQLNAYYYEGGYYFESIKDEHQETSFFLRYFDGVLSLYEKSNFFYVRKDGGELIELVHEEDKSIDFKIIEDKRYVRTLVYLTADCPGVKSKIERAHYNASELTKAIKEYEFCVNPDAKLSDADISSTKFTLGFRAGVSINRLNYFVKGANRYNNEFNDGVFSTELGAVVGVLGSMSLGRNISLQPELIFGNRTSRFSGVIAEYVGGQYVDTTVIKVSYIEIPISIYYLFPTPKIQPFVSLGGSFGLRTSNKSTRYFNDLDREAEVSGDILGISASVGVEKAISDSRKIRVEYFL